MFAEYDEVRIFCGAHGLHAVQQLQLFYLNMFAALMICRIYVGDEAGGIKILLT
jgi:hypothetical protein